jgi:hypothetical protein
VGSRHLYINDRRRWPFLGAASSAHEQAVSFSQYMTENRAVNVTMLRDQTTHHVAIGRWKTRDPHHAFACADSLHLTRTPR